MMRFGNLLDLWSDAVKGTVYYAHGWWPAERERRLARDKKQQEALERFMEQLKAAPERPHCTDDEPCQGCRDYDAIAQLTGCGTTVESDMDEATEVALTALVREFESKVRGVLGEDAAINVEIAA